MNDDAELLRRYAEEGANDAFSELVERHVNFVYSAALRQLNGDAHLAADATQLVFSDLARKAGSLVGHRVLAGWLFTSTRFVTAKLVRGERRRQVREGEAHLMQAMNSDDVSAKLDWDRVRPVLDHALGELSPPDREAILLRFFEGRDYTGVGLRLSVTANTARMRVDRALDKLRALLERRGVTSTSAALATALAHQVVAAAPAGLAATVAGTALAGGATAAGFAAAGTAGTGGLAAVVNFMSMTKLQLGFSGALAVAGASGFFVQANTNAELREEAARLREQNAIVATLQSENLQLARLAVEVDEMRRDDAEFARLQTEADTLRTRLQALARTEKAQQARAKQSGQIFDISMLDQIPVARFQARPQYPFEMRRSQIGGEVVVGFEVDRNGDVQNAAAVRASRREFEAAAVQAVSKWKFKPGRKGGADVVTRMQVPIVFSLDGANPGGETPRAPAPQPGAGSEASSVKLSDFHVVADRPGSAASQPAPAGK
jgi:RNA polymerase sigma factor (sigma-70 family)